jgi:hypothetical protein
VCVCVYVCDPHLCQLLFLNRVGRCDLKGWEGGGIAVLREAEGMAVLDHCVNNNS